MLDKTIKEKFDETRELIDKINDAYLIYWWKFKRKIS